MNGSLGLADVITCVIVGALLGVLGWWGARNAASLVVPSLDEQQRNKRARVLRRGSRAAQIFGGVLILVGVLGGVL